MQLNILESIECQVEAKAKYLLFRYLTGISVERQGKGFLYPYIGRRLDAGGTTNPDLIHATRRNARQLDKVSARKRNTVLVRQLTRSSFFLLFFSSSITAKRAVVEGDL